MAKSDRHFETADLQNNLNRRSLQSGAVAMAAQPIKLVIGIGGTMVLARLLVPADYGLLAMAQPVLSIVDSLSNMGLETATIQRQEFDREQASAIFWLSLKINALIIGGMVLCAPLVARFYDRPELTGVLLCLAVGAVSICLSFQHLSLLKRQMKFELLTVIETATLVLSTIVAVVSAWLGLGYWALILQLTALQVSQSIAYWIFCDWRPHRLDNAARYSKDLRSTLSYGIHLTGFRCISRVGMKMDRVLLGAAGGASSLGFYSMAYQWAYFPFWQIYYPLFDVAISSLSRSLSDLNRYRLYCQRGSAADLCCLYACFSLLVRHGARCHFAIAGRSVERDRADISGADHCCLCWYGVPGDEVDLCVGGRNAASVSLEPDSYSGDDCGDRNWREVGSLWRGGGLHGGDVSAELSGSGLLRAAVADYAGGFYGCGLAACCGLAFISGFIGAGPAGAAELPIFSD